MSLSLVGCFAHPVYVGSSFYMFIWIWYHSPNRKSLLVFTFQTHVGRNLAPLIHAYPVNSTGFHAAGYRPMMRAQFLQQHNRSSQCQIGQRRTPVVQNNLRHWYTSAPAMPGFDTAPNNVVALKRYYNLWKKSYCITGYISSRWFYFRAFSGTVTLQIQLLQCSEYTHGRHQPVL